MAQHDYVISDQDGASFLVDINDQNSAVVSLNSGASSPGTMYAYMLWADTTSGQLKQRNAANSAWVVIGTLGEVGLGMLSRAGGAMSGGILQLDKGADIASGATVDLGSATGNAVTVTHSSGTTAITSLGGATSIQDGTIMELVFSISGGTLTMTHNATSLYIPGGSNLTLTDKTVLRVLKISDSNAYWQVIGATKADGTPLVSAGGFKLNDIDASVASNALTITVNPTTLDFRSTTLTDGTPTTVNLASAVTVVVPDTATLGTVNATAARLAVLAINNAGTIEAAVVNLAGGNQLDETNLISTTAISTGADSSNVIYSTTARTSVAYRVVGFIDITEATAGTWATAPTLVQGTGGQALTALSSMGYGQTWQVVTGSRALSTTYYNTTGKPIQAYIRVDSGSAGSVAILTIGGVVACQTFALASNSSGYASAVIPPGMSYALTLSSGGAVNISYWAELR